MGVAVAGVGVCFLGYCIYFDRKRRSDPDFKKKLRASKFNNYLTINVRLRPAVGCMYESILHSFIKAFHVI